MNAKMRIISFALLALVSAGCATIVKGKNQTITVNSNVDGADVFLDGQKIGTTPFAGMVEKNKGTLMVQKKGYSTANVALAKTLEPMFWGNIITGGTLGSITDFASGSAYQYAPASYQVDLRPDGQPQAAFERNVAARKFAMVYLDSIAGDLGRGGGDHLSALISIVNGGKAGRADAAAIRRALVASDADPVRFGNAVVDLI